MGEVRQLIAANSVLSRNLALVRSGAGFGEVSAAIFLAELPLVTSELVTGIA